MKEWDGIKTCLGNFKHSSLRSSFKKFVSTFLIEIKNEVMLVYKKFRGVSFGVLKKFSYTNDDNPFGDEKLLDTFVWRKKMDKDGKSHMTETEQKRLIQSKQAEFQKDLEKVKVARVAREEERAMREREKDAEVREHDAMRFKVCNK